MRTACPSRAFPVVLCVIVLAIVVAATYGIAGGATAAKNVDGAITVPLPECGVTAQTDADGFCRFAGNGVQQISQVGEPSLPYKAVTVLLPPNANLSTVRARITDREWTGLDGKWDLPPVPPLAAGDCENACAVSLTGKAIINGRNTDIYDSDALFPLEPVRNVDTQVMRGWKMAQILYAPYAYNPIERQIFQLSGDAIEITFESESARSSVASMDFTSASLVQAAAVNFAEMSGEYGGYAPSPAIGRYVIITTESIKSASGSLADFVASKEARGFTVQVVTEGTWGGSTGDTAAENIRLWLQANYIGLSIRYVLLIGNPNPTTGDVPMKMCYPQNADLNYPDCPTDFYYAELTSNWNSDGDGMYGEFDDDFSGNPPRAAEVAVGRIPYYGSIAYLDHILLKIIDYETTPDSDISWRRNILLPMKPSDGSTPGYQLGEEIKDDILVPNGWTYHRVYQESYGLPDPPETTPCTYDNVKTAWNGSNFGAVFWWTHGSETTASDIMNLTNASTLDDAHPGFTFQCSCSNGKPEASNNLQYSLLKNGCIGTVSASRVSWYEPGQTSFAGTATNSGMTFEYAQRLIAGEMYAGDALNDLRFDVSPYPYQELWMNYLDFNLYGCPAVGLFTSAADQAAPSVVTYYANSVTTTSARLRANLTSLGTADNATVSFVWGTTLGGPYPNETTGQVMTGTGTFYHDSSSLTPGTIYYYQAKATGNGTTTGLVKSFTTLTTPPSVSTSSASNIATTSARLNGNLSSLGTADNVAVSFEWSTTSGGPYPHETDNQALTESGAFHFDLGSLDPATTYYCRAKARGHGDPVYGDEENFTTLTLPPSVSTDNATNLATTSARLNGNLSSLGTATSVLVCFDWGTSPGGPYPNSTENQTRSTAEPFHADLGSLTPGTIYYCRARADGDGDAVYGTEKSFTTLTKPPEVTTMQATGIAPTSATLNGNLDNLGTAASVHVSLEWGLTAGYGNTTTPQTMTDNGTFSANVVGLSVGTTYHYRAKAVGDGDPVYGSDMVFTTPPPPSVTTRTAGQVTTSSAQLNGYLSSLGYASVVTVSFEWGTSSGSYPNETIGENVTSTGTFHFSLSGLIPGTTYYYQARANGGGLPVYGGGSSFTTLAAPTVTTDDASNTAATAVTLNGNLTALGTASSVNVSFECRVSGGSYTPVAVGVKDSTGTFSAVVTGLTPGTTYYFKAKADGDGDPVFGEEKNFVTLEVPLIANVNPGTGWTGQSAIVGITGSNFTGATGVGFGPQIIVDSFTVVSDVQISAAVRILCDGTPGNSDVSVTTAGGTATLIKGFAVTDSPPNQPRNAAPVDKASVMTLTPTLTSSAFSHSCLSRTHTASQWQVTSVSGDYSNPLFNSAADSANLTAISLPRGVVGEHELYWWRVRYRDSRGIWSDWSNETSFYRPDFIRAELSGSAEIRARDSSSRVTGSMDGEPRETIPYSDYFSDTVTVVSPTDSYRYEVVGTEDGAYALSVVRLVGNQSVAFQATRIPVSAGETHQYLIDWDALSRGEPGVTIRIDSNGDGAFDRTALVDGEIDGKEFVSAGSEHGTPAWAWVLIGLGLVAATSGAFVFVLSRIAGKKPQADVLPQ